MTLNISDPAFLFPGISLLFLAFTNRYLTLASIVRTLNAYVGQDEDKNRERQIKSLHLRIVLIKYMQTFGIVAFLCCVFSMLAVISESQELAKFMFVSSLVFMVVSLVLSLAEVLKSGQSLKMELDRPRQSSSSKSSTN